jgi:hypothetical protein
MNERINELFGQALDESVPETWTTLSPTQLLRLKEKFAELIIRECAKQVDDFYQEDEFTCYCAAETIKEHFGVEE